MDWNGSTAVDDDVAAACDHMDDYDRMIEVAMETFQLEDESRRKGTPHISPSIGQYRKNLHGRKGGSNGRGKGGSNGRGKGGNKGDGVASDKVGSASSSCAISGGAKSSRQCVDPELHRFKSMRFKAAQKYGRDQRKKGVQGWDEKAIGKARRAAHADAGIDWHAGNREIKTVFALPT